MKFKSTETHRFFVPPDMIALDRVVFPTEETRHASKVLRLTKGDRVIVIDGVGGTYYCELEIITSKSAIATIHSREMNVAEPMHQIRMSVGLLKQSARWETFLEKAVELGASQITPLVSSRMQKQSFNRRRAEAILISAVKQSGRSRIPTLDEPTLFEDVISLEADCKIICHEQSSESERLLDVLAGKPSTVSMLIGPEGGFSQEEITEARAKGWKEVWLGERRLRTETAAVAALAIANQYLEL
ncbi:16S rRNA (uracil(1498)-N(3))-methyltransferase [bacterium]|nr:16S rRNA (uracil(1498)-N(3))-methyltransferase [bacterium]